MELTTIVNVLLMVMAYFLHQIRSTEQGAESVFCKAVARCVGAQVLENVLILFWGTQKLSS